MNESSSPVVVRVTETDGRVTSFWLEAGAAGRLVANGTMVNPAQVVVLSYPGCAPIFAEAWHGDRVRIRQTGVVRLEATAAGPDAQLPVTTRCG